MDCPAGRSNEAVAALRYVGGARIALAFATHADLDHVGGMYELINSVGVGEVRINLDSIVSADKWERTKLQAALRSIAGLADVGVSVLPCYWQDTGTCGDVLWRALSPTHQLLLMAQGYGDRNIGSIILRLEIGTIRVLIGGDAPAGAFERARSRGETLTADIFRLSHHGGRIDQLGGPDIGEVLDYIGAQHHVISAGTGNQYGHPLLETLEALGVRADRARVTCTEINEVCLGGEPVPFFEANSLPELAQLGAGYRAGGCRCAGSVWIQIDDNGWTIQPSREDHARVINALGNPMCRRAASHASV